MSNLTDIKYYIPRIRSKIFNEDLILAFPSFVKFEEGEVVLPGFEIHKCKEFGLRYVKDYEKDEGQKIGIPAGEHSQ